MSYARFDVMNADCLDALRNMPDCSVDAIVTDPPYGLSQHSSTDIQKALTSWLAGDEYKHGKAGFMGKSWDSFVPSPSVWRECFRVLKHGGHILCFAGSRTQDLMSIALRLAGFECRDTVMWVYGSGFPKSLDVSKAIDKAAVAEREILGTYDTRGVQEASKAGKASSGITGLQNVHFHQGCESKTAQITAPATEAARQWQGWGTALKPAYEPVLLFRKPLSGTVADNVLKHGTGALNIDGCRVGGESTRRTNTAEMGYHGGNLTSEYQTGSDSGRWPANLIHDGSDEVLAGFPVGKSGGSGADKGKKNGNVYSGGWSERKGGQQPPSEGSAARFFYCAKASKRDRGEANIHPTVKPTDLMRYLCRLITPPNGVILDPFMGSGSTGKAAMLEGFRFIGIEQSPEYFAIARARIANAVRDNFS